MNTAAVTEITWHSYSNTYYWIVKGFTERMTDKIESPEFQIYRDGDRNAAPLTAVTFKLELHPKGTVPYPYPVPYSNDVPEFHLATYRGRGYSVWAGDKPIEVECKLRMGKDYRHMAAIGGDTLMRVEKSTITYPRHRPINCARAADFPKGGEWSGEFIVSCELVHSHYTIDTVNCKVPSKALVHPRNNIQPGLYHMYTEGTLTDVDIRVDGDTIKAHKLILAAHSPVLKTMLQSDFRESATNTITIEDVGKEAFLVVLDFLYGEDMERGDIDFNTVVEMLHTAEKYDISSLKSVCEREIVKHVTVSTIVDILAICDKYGTNMKEVCEREMAAQITVDTVMELLIISDKCDANNLKERCYAFISSNKKIIYNTNQWKAVVNDYPHILIDYLTKFG